MNLRKVVQELNSKLPTNSLFGFELLNSFSTEGDITVIYLHNYGDGNKYRVYHSILDDSITTDEELVENIFATLRDEYNAFGEIIEKIGGNE